MNSWHDDMSRISTCRDVDGFMPISSAIQAIVSAPTISPNLRTYLNVVQDESMKTFRRTIRHHSHTYSARPFSPDFGGYRNNRLSLSPTPSDLCSNSTDIGFINFYRFHQLRQDPATCHVRLEPSLDAVCEATPMQCCSSQGQELSSGQGRWLHAFDWSRTTWRGTKYEAVCESGGTMFLR
jgi:hypothetical protein